MTNNELFKDKFVEADEEEDDALVEDGDTCEEYELEKFMPLKYKIADEAAATLTTEYVLSLCQNSDFTRLAVGLSNECVKLFDISEQNGLSAASVDCIAPSPTRNYNTDSLSVCDVSFLDRNCLLIATTKGNVRLFDLRTNSVQTSFKKTEEDDDGIKPLTCIDCNANGRVICAGTEKYKNDVYLLFYDVRQQKQVGAFFESHEDDVTSVRFHPQNADILCSGSTDGLINIFDIKMGDEYEALQTTINTESSVHRLNWHEDANAKDVISCITHTNDLLTYDCGEADLIASFKRADITTAAKRKNPANCNLVDAHSTADGGIFLLTGTNFKKGEILRSLNVQQKLLAPAANFIGNHQIVRKSIFDIKSQAIVTGGESGIVTLWTLQTDQLTSNATNLKTKTKARVNKATPY